MDFHFHLHMYDTYQHVWLLEFICPYSVGPELIQINFLSIRTTDSPVKQNVGAQGAMASTTCAITV